MCLKEIFPTNTMPLDNVTKDRREEKEEQKELSIFIIISF